MVLGNRGRGFSSWLFGPPARWLVARGVGPDAVTIAGTVAVVASALVLLPLGLLVAGPLVIAVFVLTDSVDGLMARQLHGDRPRPYGEFLDSTLDRFSDGAIFAGLGMWFALHSGGGVRTAGLAASFACLALGGLVSYARAKAQALGVVAKAGIAERADRLIVALVATFAVGLGAPVPLLVGALALLAAASLVTVLQRVLIVRSALRLREPA
jgi:CDP-diacylglycerol---glycerol-3-phosphate 3-phosphatidyltransferase